MGVVTRIIGTKSVLQDDRLITVATGDPAPTPAVGFSVLKVTTVDGKDVYLEYKIYDGPMV